MIRVGIGGWTYEPWRGGVFFPEKLPHSKELAHASRAVTAIEINGTFYRTQGPASFAKWRDETPDDFVFAVKGHRSVSNRKVLAEAGESIGWFLASGLSELGDKLGPILWQFAQFKKFDAEDFSAFLALLPPELDGRRLRHCVEVRHASFETAEFVDMARKYNVAICYADEATFPSIADLSGDFAYARLQNAAADEPTGYTAAALDAWAVNAGLWAQGNDPGLPRFGTPLPPAARDVFIFMINGAKEHAPAAAMELLKRLK
jgi:uncharacterized protein YecE (DUF72 family)